MPHPNYILLYVTDPSASAAFYTALLACPPVEASPTFALFALDSGLMLGLWARGSVEPAASLGGGGGELDGLWRPEQAARTSATGTRRR